MATLEIECATGDTTAGDITDSWGEGYAMCQIFTTVGSFDLDSVAMKMYKTAGATSAFQVYVVSLTGGEPPLLGTPEFTAATLANVYGDTNDLGTDTGGAWVTFDLSGDSVTLAATTQYAIVVAYSNGPGVIHWRYDTTGTYTGGKAMHFQADPASWNDYVGSVDAMFRVYSITGFSPPAGRATVRRLIGAANDALWYEDV